MAPKRGNGKGRGRTGGRGRNESQALIEDLHAQGLTATEIRSRLVEMGFSKTRRSQLMKFHSDNLVTSSTAPAALSVAAAGDHDQQNGDHQETCDSSRIQGYQLYMGIWRTTESPGNLRSNS